MKLNIIPCPAFPRDGAVTYRPGDAWFARASTELERAATSSRDTMQQVAARRWAFWQDGRLLDDTEIAAEHADRTPLIVVLPNGALFTTTCCVGAGHTVRAWQQAMAEWVDAGHGTWGDAYNQVARPPFKGGWKIVGDGDTITLSPSIHFDPGGDREWHGWLKNGVLSPA